MSVIANSASKQFGLNKCIFFCLFICLLEDKAKLCIFVVFVHHCQPNKFGGSGAQMDRKFEGVRCHFDGVMKVYKMKMCSY